MIQHLEVYVYLREPEEVNLRSFFDKVRDSLSVRNVMGEQEVLAAVIFKIIKWIRTNVRDLPTVIVIDPSREKATGNQIDW